MFKVVAIGVLVVASIVATVLLAKAYFARTHSFHVYLKHRIATPGSPKTQEAHKRRESAELAMRAGKYAEAERELLTALNAAEQIDNNAVRDDAKAFCYHDLSTLYSAQQRYTEAEPTLRKSIQIWEKDRGPNDPLVATSLNDLGALLRKTGRVDEATALESRVNAMSSTRR